MQRNNYGLVETHQRPDIDKESQKCCCFRCCRPCCFQFLRCLIGCRDLFMRCFRKLCYLICCCICRWFRCSCGYCCHQGNVQLLIPEQTSTTEGFSSAFSNVCKEISYTCQFCDNGGMLKEELPLVVVCQLSTRFESDVDGALTGIKWTKPFVVLFLHCGSESSLPSLPTADKLPNKKKYHHVKFIDVAYNMKSKLYQCEMNKTARRQLKTCLQDLKHNMDN